MKLWTSGTTYFDGNINNKYVFFTDLRVKKVEGPSLSKILLENDAEFHWITKWEGTTITQLCGRKQNFNLKNKNKNQIF